MSHETFNILNNHEDIFKIIDKEHLQLYFFQGDVLETKGMLKRLFDFEDENIFEIYLNSILTNRGNGDNIDVDIAVSTEDRIITLSTCTSNQSQRYLVQAVLISTTE